MAGKQAYQLFDITLARRTQVSPSLVRFTFTGPDVRQMASYAPDQRIKLFFAQPGADLTPLFEYPPSQDWYSAYQALPDAIRPFMRTYTIRALRPALGEVDIEFVLHGDTGPASRWAMNARPGDTLAMVAPRAGAPGPHLGFEWKPPKGVRRILLMADETAVPAAVGILEELRGHTAPPRIEAFFEVPCEDDAQPLADTAWLARSTLPAREHGERLLEAVRGIDLAREIEILGGKPGRALENESGISEAEESDAPFWEPACADDGEPFYAWIAAETRVARKLRRYLVNECGVPKRCVASMGYWRQGQAGG
ncbi:siderophore-interacting protein [Halomonas sp. HNIBRBA4712]|uniref:siderophore-interacting protein n=1 Tax=Halomonas sp. HNIBRBA4712 TaxID=3373087 RepID=UPI0037459121